MDTQHASCHSSALLFSSCQDIYYWGLRLSWRHFVLVLAAIFLLQVVVFALLSLATRGDIVPDPSAPELLLLHFLVYSGYGTGPYACNGVANSLLLSVETLFRTVYFTIMTGLLYARFAKPIPRIRFTSHCCISLRGGLSSSHPLLCLRMANDRLESLLNTQVQLTMSITKRSEDGRFSFRLFHDLPLRRNSLPTFLLPWTVMHEITDKSPLHGLSAAEMLAAGVEIFVVVNAVDSVFGGGIWARRSYGMEDILWGRKFKDVFSLVQQGDETLRVIDMAKMELTVPEDDEEKETGKGTQKEETKAAAAGREEVDEGEEEDNEEEEEEEDEDGDDAAVSASGSMQRPSRQQV
jgi:inward rectifier potassium channel